MVTLQGLSQVHASALGWQEAGRDVWTGGEKRPRHVTRWVPAAMGPLAHSSVCVEPNQTVQGVPEWAGGGHRCATNRSTGEMFAVTMNSVKTTKVGKEGWELLPSPPPVGLCVLICEMGVILGYCQRPFSCTWNP